MLSTLHICLKFTILIVYYVFSSNRKVHGQRAFLHHLQLPGEDHPRAAVSMHSLPLRAAAAEPDRAAAAGGRREGGVRYCPEFSWPLGRGLVE